MTEEIGVWEKAICVEENEQVLCDRCNKPIMAKIVGDEFYCEICQKYVWRIKK